MKQNSTKKTINVALNLLFIIPNKVGGTQTYVEGFLNEINQTRNNLISFTIICNDSYYLQLKDRFFNLDFHVVFLAKYNRPIRFLIEHVYLPFFVLKNKIDVLHSMGYTSPFLVPCKNFVTIYDLNWYFHPENFNKLTYFFWKFFVSMSARFADHILTSSDASKNAISEILKIPQKKTTRIYGGISNKQQTSKSEKGYLLTVTSLVPHKNVMNLLRAYKQALTKGLDRKLYIVGLKGKDENQVTKYINTYLKNKAVILGWVSNAKLKKLYLDAEAFIFASTYEGFGFPVLEAMSYGLPVISSSSFSLKELVENCCYIIDPHSISSISEAMITVTSSEKLKNELREKGLQQTRRFTWKKTYKQHLKAYEKFF